MDIRPDEWNEIVERALGRDVNGALSADFALRIERRLENDAEPVSAEGDWLWWTGMGILALLLVTVHVLLAPEHYREMWLTLLSVASGGRADILLVAAASVVVMELVARSLLRPHGDQ